MDLPTDHGLTLRVIWFDDDMIELECRVSYRGFRGVSTCYAVPDDVIGFASDLDHLAESAEGTPSFDSGLGDGSKRMALRAYAVDISDHLVVHVDLATANLTQRPEGIWRIALEMETESWPLSQFAQRLRSVVQARDGSAFLQAVH